MVMEGSWREIHTPNTTMVDNKEKYWRSVFESLKETILNHQREGNEWKWEVIQAITKEEKPKELLNRPR